MSAHDRHTRAPRFYDNAVDVTTVSCNHLPTIPLNSTPTPFFLFLFVHLLPSDDPRDIKDFMPCHLVTS